MPIWRKNPDMCLALKPRLSLECVSVAAFGVPLAYGVLFWLVLQHHQAGAHEAHELPLVVHWLRDATLALPLILVAVWLGLRLTRRLWPDDASPAARAALVALLGSVALGAGAPAHAWLFGIEEDGDLPILEHILGDALAALPPALLIVGAITVEQVIGRRRRRGRPSPVGSALRLAGAGVLVLTTALAGWGGAGEWRASADNSDALLSNQSAAANQDLSRLRDRVDPCFNNSPVAPPFLPPLPIPPTLAPVERNASADHYVITEQRSEAEIIPGITTPVWGYNGLVPGPTIQARKLREVDVNFVNSLPPGEDPAGIINQSPPPEGEFRPSSTVVHLHGINAEHRSDGYAAFTNGHEHRKDPGQSFLHHYPNNAYQRPFTGWYHDHSVHITSQHLYRGLAGLYLLTDSVEDVRPCRAARRSTPAEATASSTSRSSSRT